MARLAKSRLKGRWLPKSSASLSLSHPRISTRGAAGGAPAVEGVEATDSRRRMQTWSVRDHLAHLADVHRHAGLEMSGWSDGRLEFKDGRSKRTAVPRILRAGKNNQLSGDACPLAATQCNQDLWRLHCRQMPTVSWQRINFERIDKRTGPANDKRSALGLRNDNSGCWHGSLKKAPPVFFQKGSTVDIMRRDALPQGLRRIRPRKFFGERHKKKNQAGR